MKISHFSSYYNHRVCQWKFSRIRILHVIYWQLANTSISYSTFQNVIHLLYQFPFLAIPEFNHVVIFPNRNYYVFKLKTVTYLNESQPSYETVMSLIYFIDKTPIHWKNWQSSSIWCDYDCKSSLRIIGIIFRYFHYFHTKSIWIVLSNNFRNAPPFRS